MPGTALCVCARARAYACVCLCMPGFVCLCHIHRPPQYFSSIDSLADHHSQTNSPLSSPARGGESNRAGVGGGAVGDLLAERELLRVAESRVAELEARLAELEQGGV